jgi:hypothetical protein
MPRRTRRQLVGKEEDVERREREEELRALERELHQEKREEVERLHSSSAELVEKLASLSQAKIMALRFIGEPVTRQIKGRAYTVGGCR